MNEITRKIYHEEFITEKLLYLQTFSFFTVVAVDDVSQVNCITGFVIIKSLDLKTIYSSLLNITLKDFPTSLTKSYHVLPP